VISRGDVLRALHDVVVEVRLHEANPRRRR
jgi:hypothetical protein